MRVTGDTSEMTARRPGDALGRRPTARVLVAEDERDVAELIRYTLDREGFEVVVATNGADALRQARDSRPDLVLLDLMLPQVNGWELCRRLKQDPATRALPVIMLTARSEEGDKVLGFELGADDYVTKPFSTRELVARVRAVVRRSRPAEAEERRHRITVGDLVVDRQRFEVTVGGRAVALTPKEFELWRRSPPSRAASSAAMSCSTWSGGGTASSSPGPWTSTSRVFGPSSWRRACPSPASRRSGGWGTGTGRRADRPRNADVTSSQRDRHAGREP